jgi:TRAP-type transport system periplasmic protein
MVLMRKQSFDALSADQQRSIRDAAREFGPGWRQAAETWNNTAVEQCKSRGLTVDQADKAAFGRAMAPVYDEYRGKFGSDYVDRVVRLAGA